MTQLVLLFSFMPFLCDALTITHYLYNMSFNLQITIDPSDLNSCWQLVSESNMVSSINNIYHSKLTTYPLFNIVSTPETNVVHCLEDDYINVLLETNMVVVSIENDTETVTTFYTNSLNDIQIAYPQYTLAYTHQNIKIEIFDYNPSSTNTFNASDFYTTSDNIPSVFTSRFLVDSQEDTLNDREVWKLSWWQEWHSWKIFGVAAFGAIFAITCLICCVVCYKCCCCKRKCSNKHKKLPTEDIDDENAGNNNDEKEQDGPKLHVHGNKKYSRVLSDTTTNVFKDVLPSHNKHNNYDPIPPSGNDESDTDSSFNAMYEKPKKIKTARGTTKIIPLTLFSNNNSSNDTEEKAQMGIVEPKIYSETDSNRVRNDSMSVPPIPPSPHNGEGNEPCLLSQNKAGSSHKYDIKSRASKEYAAANVNCEEENKYNKYIDQPNGAKFSNYKPVPSHSRFNSKTSFSMSCGDSVGSDEMYERPMYNEIRINIDDDKHKEVMDWFLNDVRLPNADTAKYFDVFLQNGFDTLESVSNMKYDDLEAIGIKKRGHVQRFHHVISKLKLAPSIVSPATHHKYCSSNSSITHEYPSQLSGIDESNKNKELQIL